MDSENYQPELPLLDLPREFYNSETQQPIANCLMCNRFLLSPGTTYMIEKAIKQHHELNFSEPIFEYAMCMDCAVKMNAALSEESRMRISAYFQTHVNFEKRREQLMQANSREITPWIERCLVKNTVITSCREYQLVAQCYGSQLLMTDMPFALSIEAMEEMSELLSAKSRGEMDDFIGQYFSGPPEVAELLKKKFVLL